jgi:hypothetical protein
MYRCLFSIVFVLYVSSAPSAWARNFLELESRYLGDGWFQYRIKVFADPMWQAAVATGVLIGCTNRAEYGAPPENWATDASDPNYAWWTFSDAIIPDRPYEAVLSVRSGQTSIKTLPTGAVIGFKADTHPDFVSSNLTASSEGFKRLGCLAPCSPSEADGSPTNLVSRFELVPDLSIDRLLFVNGLPQGLAVSWKYPSTVGIEATFDFLQWTNIAYALTSPPKTNWVSNVPLNTSGSYFRLRLVATEHRTNLVNGAGADTNGSLLFDRNYP